MALGIIPARGDWEYRRSAVTTSSQGAFQKGDLVGLDKTRVASLYTSSNFSSYYGVAMHDSGNSLPANQVLLGIPRPGCTAFVDLATNEATSVTSFGQTGSIISANGRTSQWSQNNASVWSKVCEIVGPVDSILSRVEVAFILNTAVIYSTSSNTYT